MITPEQILQAKILIIEDDRISIKMIEEILVKAGYRNICALTDPRDACQAYQKFQPDLILLDLNMPYLNGFQVMEVLKRIDFENYLPVLVITEDDNQETRLRALNSGAKDFLNKPYERLEVLNRIKNMLEVRLLHQEVLKQNKILENKVSQRTKELYETRMDVIRRLAKAAEFRDQQTGEHIIRMSKYCDLVAREVGFNKIQRDLLLNASPLHDIGKIGIPDQILLKPGKLTKDEFDVIKTHPAIGGAILEGSQSAFLKMAEVVALTHHEKWDGSGYPNGLVGHKIPIVGRITGICDVFDALTSERPYKLAWSVPLALEEIKAQSGRHFDPEIVDCFFQVLPEIQMIKNQYTQKSTQNVVKI